VSFITFLSPYIRLARLDKPTGAYLVMLPCWWGVALASGGWPQMCLLALFAVGAFVMRGAGCAYNDVVDRDFDRKVERTKNRPVASGELTRFQGLMFAVLLSCVGLLILLQFPIDVIYWGAASLVLVSAYPWMKRITYWPQLFLGLTFNWGVWMGWFAVQDIGSWKPFFLYAAGIFWTLSYDTIYAHQDTRDDVNIGVKSTALLWGGRTSLFLWTMSVLMFLCLCFAGWDLGATYFMGLGVLVGYCVWQNVTFNPDDPYNCWIRFKANQFLGFGVFAAIVLSKVLG